MSHQRINISLVGWVIGDEILPNDIKLYIGNSVIKNHSRDPFFCETNQYFMVHVTWFFVTGQSTYSPPKIPPQK